MTAFFEPSLSFWLLLAFLLLAAALLAAMWTATARREPLIAAGIALALLPVAWMVERLVVTDREAIEATLLSIAADVKANNRAAVLGYVHSEASALRAKAEQEMANYRFTECKINQVREIRVDAAAQPRTAVADFNVYADGTFRVSGETVTTYVIRRIILDLKQEADGRWRVVDYQHTAPLPGRRSESGDER